MKRNLFALVLLTILAVLIAACAQPPDVDDVVPEEPAEEETAAEEEEPAEAEPEEEMEEPEEEMMEEEPTQVAQIVIPFLEQWQNSPHNAAEDDAFTHWNEDDPAEIPPFCAECHSTPGYLDALGADGSEPGVVDSAHPIGTTITCEACHNDVTVDKSSVVFPSGVEVTELDSSATCMECHQGRSSTNSVNEAIAEAGLEGDADTASEDLGFVNIHYYAAAATLLGSDVAGGYQYEGQAYQPAFEHVAGFDTCVSCHEPHTTEVDPTTCAECHEGVTSSEDLRGIRMAGSLVDYDGDGSIDEPILGEIEGLQEMLFTAIQAYADEVAGTPIVYSTDAYPYFFIDSNADGEIQDDEASFPNQYNAFTPRLLQATYNYQVSKKDPGGFVHNAKYQIQLLYDSIESLNEAIAEPVDLSAADRADAGHFAATHEAFRHWDEDEPAIVPGRCSKCHVADGVPLFLENGVSINQEPTNSLSCSTCHDSLSEFTIYDAGPVTFPSGATLTFNEDDEGSLATNNICLQCHQGRESTVGINDAIANAGVGDDEISEALRFRNPHYFAAGATLFGGEAQGAYQFEGNEYLGRFMHVESFDNCSECHDVHALTVNEASCAGCHGDGALTDIRADGNEVDYDGDGELEGIANEISTLHEALFVELQAYALETTGEAIVYNPAAYPYWFIDTNGNGVADPDESNYGNQFPSWTPNLLRSAYNYTWVAKDPGGYSHNGQYLIQVLYDTLENLGADVSTYTRP